MANLTLTNLTDPIFIEKLNEQVNKIEFFNDTREALYLSRDIEKLLVNSEKNIKNIELIRIIKIILVKLKFILFNTLSENEILEIFNRYLVIGIKMAYIDLSEILKMRISFIPLDMRDELKEKIKKIILNNQEEITSESIINDQIKIRPTIAAWIKLYNKELGTGPVNNLVQNKFYISNQNFNKLNELQKLEIKELFNIYEYLKRSSLTIEGNEDDTVITDIDGKDYWLKEGKFIRLDIEDKNKITVQKTYKNKEASSKFIDELDNFKQLLSKYPLGSLEHKAIEEELEKMERGGKKVD